MEKIRETIKRYPEFVSLSLFILIGAIIIFATNKLFSILAPFIIAYIITRMLRPLMVKIQEKTHMPKIINTLLCMFLCVVLLSLIVWLAGYYILSGAEYLINILSSRETLDIITDTVKNIALEIDDGLKFFNINIEISDVLNNISELIKVLITFVSNFSIGIVTGVPSFLMSFIIGCVSAFYMLYDFDKISEFILCQCGDKTKKIIQVFNNQVLLSLIKMIISYVFISMICFIELLIGFYILNIKDASFIALIIAIFDVLPIVGSGAIIVPWGIIALATGKTYIGIGLFVLWGVITVVRQILEPKIVGEQVGLHPLLTVAVLYLGLKLMGGVGLVVGPLYILVCKKLTEENIVPFYKLPTPKTEQSNMTHQQKHKK